MDKGKKSHAVYDARLEYNLPGERPPTVWKDEEGILYYGHKRKNTAPCASPTGMGKMNGYLGSYPIQACA